jgi:thioredoxin reductase
MMGMYDVVIAGGGPAGLSAALYLGRARKRVLLCDTGPARNAAATHVHGFLTRDGTPPAEMRRIGREQLAPYGTDVREVPLEEVRGEAGDFTVRLGDGSEVRARRLLLCTGMIDEPMDVPGYRELWGQAIFQCPYCHGWEVQDRAWGCLVTKPELVDFGVFLRGWSRQVTVFTDGRFAVPAEARARMVAAGVGLEERRIAALVRADTPEPRLEAVELEGGVRVPCEVIFTKPNQRQPAIVARLGLELGEQGFVRVDEQMRTSRPGVYAAGDLTTMLQGAIVAASAGCMAATMLNHQLTVELATGGGLDG